MAIKRADLSAFGPDEIKVLTSAFEQACIRLGRDSRTADDVAHAIVSNAQVRGLDRERLIEAATKVTLTAR